MKLVHKLHSPLKVYIHRKTKDDKAFILNLNVYRNTHHRTLNDVKKIYKEAMQNQIAALPALRKIAVRFVLFPQTRRLTDTPNVCSIHDKFFMDALVESDKLPGDDYNHYVETGYKFGAVDKTNPRVEIEIYAVG